MSIYRLRKPRPSRQTLAFAAGICLIGVAAVQACSAGGADESLWDPGGNPAPSGHGGNGGATAAVTATTGQSGNTTGQGAGTTTGQGAGTTTSTSHSSSSSTTTGAGAGTTTSTTTGTSTTSTSTTTSSTSSSSGVTWTEIYNGVFGPSGTSTCTGSSCHTNSRSGFKCGTSASTCYTGFVSDGYVTAGSSASSSAIVDPSQTCLCGSGLSGNMPKGHACLTAAQITQIKTWLAAGAPNN
jgi:hypothetical protein